MRNLEEQALAEQTKGTPVHVRAKVPQQLQQAPNTGPPNMSLVGQEMGQHKYPPNFRM